MLRMLNGYPCILVNMKRILLILTGLVLMLLLTNPGLEKHKQAVYDDVASRFTQDATGAAITNRLGSDAVFSSVRRDVERKVSRQNYYLFSVTVITYPETNNKLKRTVGLGLIGNVFLWSGM